MGCAAVVVGGIFKGGVVALTGGAVVDGLLLIRPKLLKRKDISGLLEGIYFYLILFLVSVNKNIFFLIVINNKQKKKKRRGFAKSRNELLLLFLSFFLFCC